MDFDYILKLEGDEEALRFLNQFVKEYYNASLQDAEFFTTEEEKKEIYLNNNARNRCSYGRAKAMDNLRPYIEDYDKDKDD